MFEMGNPGRKLTARNVRIMQSKIAKSELVFGLEQIGLCF